MPAARKGAPAAARAAGRCRPWNGRDDIVTSLDTLVRRHGAAVMRLLLRILDHRQEAEDAWQETWYAVWRARHRLREGPGLWPFIRRCATRKALDARRRPDRRLARLENEPSAAEPRTVDGPEPELRLLPPRERACLVLFFWEGLSVAEIAGELGVPEGSVKTWMFRGRARLRRALGERQQEEAAS